MDHFQRLGLLVFIDAVDISIGGFILRYVSLVPIILTALTYVAVAIILVDSIYIFMNRIWAEKLGVILAIIAMIISTNPSHITGLSEFGSTVALSAADITMVIGFYLLPIIYLCYYYFSRKSLHKTEVHKESGVQ